MLFDSFLFKENSRVLEIELDVARSGRVIPLFVCYFRFFFISSIPACFCLRPSNLGIYYLDVLLLPTFDLAMSGMISSDDIKTQISKVLRVLRFEAAYRESDFNCVAFLHIPTHPRDYCN